MDALSDDRSPIKLLPHPVEQTRPLALVVFYLPKTNCYETNYYLCHSPGDFNSIFQSVQTYKEEYRQKSKKQRTTGYILVCSGVLLNVSGAIAYQKGNAGIILFGAGLLADVAGIPFFVSAGVNKRKAMNASAFFKLEQTNNIRGMAMSPVVYPAISFKLNL